MKIGTFCFNIHKLICKFYVLPTILILHCRDYATKKIEIYDVSICFLKYELVLMYKLPF